MSPSAATSPCPSCAGRRIVLKASDRGVAEASACPVCVSACTRCDGEGWISEEGGNGYTYTKPCSCYGSRQRVQALNRAKLPARYAGKLVGPLAQKEGYPLSTAQAAAQLRTAAWAKDYKKGARGLLFHGPYGTGKSLLLCRALAALALGRGVGVRYVEFGLMWSELLDAFDPHRDPTSPSPGEIRGPLRDVQVLAIDELGRARTPGEQEELERLISSRYQAGKTTLFATNFSPTEPRPGAASSLEEHVGGRVWSRLCQTTEIVEVSGADYRRMG
jgi:DNA replication protein DnaC